MLERIGSFQTRMEMRRLSKRARDRLRRFFLAGVLVGGLGSVLLAALALAVMVVFL